MKHIITALALIASTTASAQFRDGNKLLEELNASSAFSQGLSLGYVMAITDVMQGYNQCAPSNVTAGQINDMVKNYITNSPHERHLPASELIMKVNRAVWPCPKKGGSL
jgi:hypothetical protein